MIHRTPARRLALVIAVFFSLASARLLHSAVIVTRPADPVQVFGAQSTINVPVDIDGDGLMDFNFNLKSTFQLTLEPLTGGQMVTTTAGGRVTPINSETRIGSTPGQEGTEWAGRSSLSACATFPEPSGYVCLGEFFGLDAYIGIAFPIDGQIHYGWIRFRHFEINPGGWIIEWAYETTPGAPIYAGLKPVPLKAPVIARPGFLRLEWPAETGRTYQVQAKGQLDAPAWSNLSFALPATSTNIMVDLPMQADAQFFRLIEVE